MAKKRELNLPYSYMSPVKVKGAFKKYMNFNMTSPTIFNGYYASKFIEVMNNPITKLKAYELGIIDKNGKEKRKPKQEESEDWNYFIKTVLFFKKKLYDYIPSKSQFDRFARMLYKVVENLNNLEINNGRQYIEERINNIMDETMKKINEDGTSTGGIAASGAVMSDPALQKRTPPQTVSTQKVVTPKKKEDDDLLKKLKDPKILKTFKDFIKSTTEKK